MSVRVAKVARAIPASIERNIEQTLDKMADSVLVSWPAQALR